MTVSQIAKILAMLPGQQIEVWSIDVYTTEPGVDYLGVTFKDGTIDYYDGAGKPVMMT